MRFRHPVLFFFLFLAYLALVVVLSGFYSSVPLILVYASSVSWVKLSISLVLSLLIALLVAYNGVLVYAAYRLRRQCKDAKLTASLGAVGGVIVGVCPLCVTGLVPLLLGVFGLSFSFASLPFGGIEMQVLVVAVLCVSMYLLKKKA